MDFEIGHLDIISSQESENQRPAAPLAPAHASQSVILNELQKEIEDLQNKLKLNHRRLLLFETENNKLLEEKNKFYFEAQNYSEKNKILLEKNSSLEAENEKFEEHVAFLKEKVQTYSQINETQLAEIKRFTKFHHKIQNVIKPYIQELKSQVASLKGELTRTEKLSEVMSRDLHDLGQKLNLQKEQSAAQVANLEIDRKNMISSYEEQIHSFSKEIVNLQQQNDELRNEISRLKKNVEFKNYFENELIKFKRIHEEDQREITTLKEKMGQMIVASNEKDQNLGLQSEKLNTTQIQLQNAEQILEATRAQLAKQIEHGSLLAERLNRLEKLNLNLSQQMHPMP